MKKTLLFLSISLIALLQPLQAQEQAKEQAQEQTQAELMRYDDPFLNEIYIEYGTRGAVWGVAVPMTIGIGSIFGSAIIGVTKATLETIFTGNSPDQLNVKVSGFQSYGVADLCYQHRFKKKQWLGIGLDVSYTFCRVYGDIDNNKVHKDVHIIMPMFGMNFYYFRRKHITFYSGFSAGCGIWKGPVKSTPFFSMHLTGFGISAGGQHLRYHCEVGSGVKGFINMGLGYKF